jgi:hypothetical protein
MWARESEVASFQEDLISAPDTFEDEYPSTETQGYET